MKSRFKNAKKGWDGSVHSLTKYPSTKFFTLSEEENNLIPVPSFFLKTITTSEISPELSFFYTIGSRSMFHKRAHHLQQAALVFAHVPRCLLPSTGILQSVLLLHSLIVISLSKPLTCLLGKGYPFYSTLLQAQDYR